MSHLESGDETDEFNVKKATHTSASFCSFSRELPSRFKKELVKSVLPPSQSAASIDVVNQILVNIGQPEQQLSEQELFVLNDGQQTITANQMMELLRD